jgi:hypothetical protein
MAKSKPPPYSAPAVDVTPTKAKVESPSAEQRLWDVLQSLNASPRGFEASSEDFIAPITLWAEQVLGDKQVALRWLGTPIRALGYATPVSLLSTKEGAESVGAVLTRLEHDVF